MTPLYLKIMQQYGKDKELAEMVWNPTPFVVNIKADENLRYQMSAWMSKNIGTESQPIHFKPGDWYWSGATVDNMTWLGFRTKGMLQNFYSVFHDAIVKDDFGKTLMKFDSYYKFEFSFIGGYAGQPIYCRCGGDSESIYRFHVSTEAVELAKLSPNVVFLNDGREIVWEL